MAADDLAEAELAAQRYALLPKDTPGASGSDGVEQEQADGAIAEQQHAALASRRSRLASGMRGTPLYRLLAESDVPNPFIPTTWGRVPTPLERASLVFCAVLLVPFRAVLLLVVVLSALATAALVTAGLSKEQLRQPLAPWRACLQWLLRQHLRAALFALGYVQIREKGRLAPAPILVCNHHGFVEALYLAWATGASFVGEEQTLGLPGFATLSAAMQTVLVRRTSPTSRADAQAEIRRRALIALKPGAFALAVMPRIAIFPESTTTNGRALIVFKPGAFAPGLAVQPVTVRFPPYFKPDAGLGLWPHFDPSWVYGNPGLFGIALGLMCRPINRMDVTFLPACEPSAAERADAKLFAARVRETMAAALRVPMTGHSLGDVALQREAVQLHLPVDKVVVQVSQLHSAFDIERCAIERLMRRFAQIDTACRGELTLEQWLSALADEGGGSGDAEGSTAELRPELEAVFNLLDVRERGTVTFREWLLGLLLLSAAADDPTNAANEDALHFAWIAIAGSLAGRLTRAQVVRLLCIRRNGKSAMSEESAASIFADADGDGDGQISYPEFVAHAGEHPELLRAFVNRLIIRSRCPRARASPRQPHRERLRGRRAGRRAPLANNN